MVWLGLGKDQETFGFTQGANFGLLGEIGVCDPPFKPDLHPS